MVHNFTSSPDIKEWGSLETSQSVNNNYYYYNYNYYYKTIKWFRDYMEDIKTKNQSKKNINAHSEQVSYIVVLFHRKRT